MRSIDTDSMAPAVPKPRGHRLPPRLPIHKAALLGLSCMGDPTRLPYLLLPKIANRYGDIVRLFTGPTPALTLTLINHPDYVDHVFTRHHDRYVKHEATIELVSGEPVALPLLEGQEWKRVRSAFNPYFGERALAQATPLMMEGITDRVDAWSRHVNSGELVDLEHELGAVVMDGLMRSMFKVRLSPTEIDHAVDGARRYGVYVISRVAMHFLPRWLPNPLRRSGEEAKAELFGILDRFVQERAGCPSTGTPDLVDTLLALEFDGCPKPGNEDGARRPRGWSSRASRPRQPHSPGPSRCSAATRSRWVRPTRKSTHSAAKRWHTTTWRT